MINTPTALNDNSYRKVSEWFGECDPVIDSHAEQIEQCDNMTQCQQYLQQVVRAVVSEH